jgi:DNA recombination protein RmuC
MIPLCALLAAALAVALFRERKLASCHEAALAAERDRHARELAVERDRHAQELGALRQGAAADAAAQREWTGRREGELTLVREQLIAVESARSALEARLHAVGDQQALLDRAQKRMEDSIAVAARQALDANSAHNVQLAEQVLLRAQESSKAELEKRAQAVEQIVKPVEERLHSVAEKIGKLEKSNEVATAAIGVHVQSLITSEERLRCETERLRTALRAPGTRGRWGEIQLRRSLDLAGLRPHVDFQEQPVASLPDGVLRPDAVIRLPGNKTVLLDSKVPLEAYLRAIEASPEEREPLLRAHASQLRAHIESLSRKQYWNAFEGSPEWAVLFLPATGLLEAALEAAPALHEEAFERRIILATPATLHGLLLTIAHVWKQESLAENAREIANEGRDLHKRLAILSAHLARLGNALESSLKAYNAVVGSFDSRVVPAAARFEKLRAASADVRLEPLAEVDVLPRLPRSAAAEEVSDGAN